MGKRQQLGRERSLSFPGVAAKLGQGLDTAHHFVERADDRRVISGIVHVLKSGCRWCDCPPEYGPPTTIYNRFVRWARRGVWENLFREHKGQLFRCRHQPIFFYTQRRPRGDCSTYTPSRKHSQSGGVESRQTSLWSLQNSSTYRTMPQGMT